MFIPVTYSIWSVVYWLGDGTAFLFRLLNLAVHNTNIVLIYFIIRKNNILRGQFQIFTALALFALHPVQVESVAWITGGKDLLSTMFALFAVLTISHKKNGLGRNFAALILFILGLLCKPSIAVLPVIIFSIQALQYPKEWRSILVKMFIWIIPVLLITYLTYSDQSAVTSSQPLLMRFLIASHAIGFYIIKVLLPTSLSADYGLSPYHVINNFYSQLLYLLTAISAAIIIFFVSWNKKITNQSIILIIAWFAWMLPVTGIIPFGFQEFSTVADRYLYFSLFFLATFISKMMQDVSFLKQKRYLILFCVYVGYLAPTSYQRVLIWKDNSTFYNDMYLKNNNSYSANMGLGELEYNQKHYQKALSYFTSALHIRQGDVGTLDKLLKTQIQLNNLSAIFEMEKYIIVNDFERIILIRHTTASNILSRIAQAHFEADHLELAGLYYCWASRINVNNKEHQENLAIIKNHITIKKISFKCDPEMKWPDFVDYRKTNKY